MLLKFLFHLLLVGSLSSCGTRNQESNNVLIPQSKKTVEPTPQSMDTEPAKAINASMADAANVQALTRITLQFSRRDALSKLEPFAAEVVAISKKGTSKTLFSMASGGAYIYDETTEFVEYLQPVVKQAPGSKIIRLFDNINWAISANKLEYIYPSASTPDSLRVVSVNFDNSALSLLHASAERLIFKSANGLQIVTRTIKDVLSLESFKGIPELDELLPNALLAGFGPNNSFLWVASSSKVLFFKNSTSGFIKKPLSAELAFGLPSGTDLEKMVVEFDDTMQPLGKTIFARGGKFYVSGYTPAAAALSWDIDIRPIAEQYCVSCHGDGGAGGFSKANESASWTGIKRNSIIERVVTQKSMPPIDTVSAKSMTDIQRNKIKDWLSLGFDSTSSPTSASKSTSTTEAEAPSSTISSAINASAIPTLGSTWSEIEPIIMNRCGACHPTYPIYSTFYAERAKIKRRTENDSMPPRDSRRGALTTSEKDALLRYLSSLP